MLGTTHLHLFFLLNLLDKDYKMDIQKVSHMRSYNIFYNIYFKDKMAKIKAVNDWYKGS